MPRIIVTTDPGSPEEREILLDEHVHSVHLSTSHAAAQLVQRLAWAVEDAERLPSSERPKRRRRAAARPRARISDAHAYTSVAA